MTTERPAWQPVIFILYLATLLTFVHVVFGVPRSPPPIWGFSLFAALFMTALLLIGGAIMTVNRIED
ncbi:MAG TPA: hypothetical protein VJH91_01770 [Candidatus Paceibacterota bacterium]